MINDCSTFCLFQGSLGYMPIMLLRLYVLVYSMQNKTEHVRVGFTPVGLSWTSFSSLLAAFIHGLSQNLGSGPPLRVRSSDLLLASNEPPRWLLGKRNKKAVCPIASFPTTKGCLTLLTYPWCTTIGCLCLAHVLFWSSTNNNLSVFLKYSHIQPRFLSLSSHSLSSTPSLSLARSLFLTRTPPSLSAFVLLFGRALA